MKQGSGDQGGLSAAAFGALGALGASGKTNMLTRPNMGKKTRRLWGVV